MLNLTPRIRVEVYFPIRYEDAYRHSLAWVIEEFTQLRGGCTVNENVGGYYLSRANKVIEDRVSVVYSDFPMNWDLTTDRADMLSYCASLKEFLFANLWEEEIMISAYQFHTSKIGGRLFQISSWFTILNKFLPALNTSAPRAA